MTFCSHCGSALDSPYCTKCGTQSPVVVPAETTRTAPEGDSLSSPPDGFFRSPLQVAILAYATFGLYGVYWLIRGRRLAENRLGEPRTSYWWYLFWIIPIVGLVSGIKCAGRMQERIVVANAKGPPVSLGVQAFFFFILFFIGNRLADPYWLFSIVAPICLLGSMHVSLARAERADYPLHRWPRFGAWEWIISIVGACIWIFGIFGLATELTSEAQEWFVGLTLAAALLSLLMFGLLSREGRAIGLEES